MERRDDHPVRRLMIGAGAAADAERVEHVLGVAVVRRHGGEFGEDRDVLDRTDPRLVDRIDHRVTEMARHALLIERVRVGRRGVPVRPGDRRRRHVAAQAVRVDVRDVLLGGRELREVERVAARVRHQAAAPCGARFVLRRVAAVAEGARLFAEEGGFVHVALVRAGHDEVLRGGGHRQGSRRGGRTSARVAGDDEDRRRRRA
jgi:hypothetical protein